MLAQKTADNSLANEIFNFIDSRKSLLLATKTSEGLPYASYAPFAIGDDCLYVLLSEIAIHALNLQMNPEASVLIIQDETEAEELFARLRVNYSVKATLIGYGTPDWEEGIKTLSERHGKRIHMLSKLDDFKLFELTPQGGRYVKDFGKAYSITGNSLTGDSQMHLVDGHQKRKVG